MSVELANLNDSDKGRYVVYARAYGEPERGRVKSWNQSYVFVVYRCNGDWEHFEDYTAQATLPSDLRFEGTAS